jgi:hypothetical protein
VRPPRGQFRTNHLRGCLTDLLLAEVDEHPYPAELAVTLSMPKATGDGLPETA